MADLLDSIRGELHVALADTESAEATVASDLTYTPSDPIVVHVRKRGIRYDLGDRGRAVEPAGRPPGWLAVAETVVAERGLNVNRAGVVFISAVEGRDLAELVIKVAETSRAVYAELLEHGDTAAG